MCRRTLSARENLLRVLRHERPEWVPLCGHCDPYAQPNRRGMDPELARAMANVQWSDESMVTFSRYLDLDIMDWYDAPVKRSRRKVISETSGDAETCVTVWHTSRGQLRQVQRYSPETHLWYIAEHAVKDVSDLGRLGEVFADIEYSIAAGGAAKVQARQRLIGDGGLIMFSINGTPLGEMVRVHAGVETLAYLWADARQELHDLFGVMEASYRRYLDLALSLRPDAVVAVDDTSTTTISPAMFEEFCLDYTDRAADAVHAAGAFYFHHSCGLIRDVLPLYRQTRMDAVHAFTTPPGGNVTVAEGRERLGPRITIIRGLAYAATSGARESRKAVAESIRTQFHEGAPGDHYILLLCAHPHTTMDEMRFIREECRKHQQL